MRHYPLTLSIILLGCSQNIGSLSIASTQPVEIDKRYQSIGLIEEIKPVETIINETITEFNEICDSMASIKF